TSCSRSCTATPRPPTPTSASRATAWWSWARRSRSEPGRHPAPRGPMSPVTPLRAPAMIPYSLLDLAPVFEGDTPAQAFAKSLDLARHAERLGYRRFWLAEHHNMPAIASAATALLIGHIAGGTSTIRVGA